MDYLDWAEGAEVKLKKTCKTHVINTPIEPHPLTGKLKILPKKIESGFKTRKL
jgi:hypothetical protein